MTRGYVGAVMLLVLGGCGSEDEGPAGGCGSTNQQQASDGGNRGAPSEDAGDGAAEVRADAGGEVLPSEHTTIEPSVTSDEDSVSNARELDAGSGPRSISDGLTWSSLLRADYDQFPTLAVRLFLEPGAAWVVMLRNVYDKGAVSVRRLDLATKEWGTEQRIDDGTGDATSLSVSSNAQGDAIVAWNDWDAEGEVTVRTSTYSVETSAWAEPEVVVSGPGSVGFTLAVSPASGGIIAWGERTVESTVDSLGEPAEVLTTQYRVKAFDGKQWGDATTVWQREDESDFGFDTGYDFWPLTPVFADADHVWGFFDWNGALSAVSSEQGQWAEPQEIGTGVYERSTVVLADGVVQAAWLQDGSVFASRSEEPSGEWSSPKRIETFTPSASRLSLTRVDGNSSMVAAATWIVDGDVYAATMDAKGAWSEPGPVGAEFSNLATIGVGNSPWPHIGASASGRLFVGAANWGFAVEASDDGQQWSEQNAPFAYGKWFDEQFVVAPDGTVLFAAILLVDDTGPENGEDHAFVLIGE